MRKTTAPLALRASYSTIECEAPAHISPPVSLKRPSVPLRLTQAFYSAILRPQGDDEEMKLEVRLSPEYTEPTVLILADRMTEELDRLEHRGTICRLFRRWRPRHAARRLDSPLDGAQPRGLCRLPRHILRHLRHGLAPAVPRPQGKAQTDKFRPWEKYAARGRLTSTGGVSVLYSICFYFARSSFIVSPRILMPFSIASSELLE